MYVYVYNQIKLIIWILSLSVFVWPIGLITSSKLYLVSAQS